MAAKNDIQKKIVRRYLTNLADNVESKGITIHQVGQEYDVPVKTLRSFRDGNDASLPSILVNAWAKVLGADGDLLPVTGMTAPSPVENDWYQRTIAREYQRIERMHQYEIIDSTRPEAASALDCWADIAITGGIGDGRRADFEPEVIGGTRIKAAMKEISIRINQMVVPTDDKLKIARDMAKYGNQYEQPAIGYEGGRPVIQRLVNMPIKTMWKKIQPDGSWDQNDAYYQMLPGKTEPIASWPGWKMVDFGNNKSRSNYYGTSVFESGMRAYTQIEAMEAAMIIRRLERAPLRMKHVIDVGHLSNETEIKAAKEDYRNRSRKVRTIDQNQQRQMQRINMPADEDYIVAKRDKDSPSDITTLEGDSHIGIITDYSTFFNKWLAGLGPPKAHIGYEEGTMRSVVTDLHIVFARKGRRFQMQFMKGMHHLFWLQMILDGIDPRSVNYQIIPPSMGTKDETMRAQVLNTHASTIAALAKAFAQTGKVPSIQWFLRYILGLDEDTLEALELSDVVLTAKGALEDPTVQAPGGTDGKTPSSTPGNTPNSKESQEMLDIVYSNPDLVAEINRTTWLLGERSLQVKKPHLMGIELPKVLNPFGHQFEDVVRMIRPVGQRELKVLD